MPEQPEDRQLSALYKQIPQQRSPEELDQQILEQARSRAAGRQRMMPTWMPLASAVAVMGLVVGLLIQQPEVETVPEPMSLEESAAPSLRSQAPMKARASAEPKREAAAPEGLMQDRAASQHDAILAAILRALEKGELERARAMAEEYKRWFPEQELPETIQARLEEKSPAEVE